MKQKILNINLERTINCFMFFIFLVLIAVLIVLLKYEDIRYDYVFIVLGVSLIISIIYGSTIDDIQKEVLE